MRNKLVTLNSVKDPIKPSPGFAKKLLSEHKLDVCGLCGFGCRYCSSNHGNYLRIRREPFADVTEAQLGERILPTDDPALMFLWPDVLDRLKAQLARKRPGFGLGKTLVFSMLTDGFSPELVKRGVTAQALQLILDYTQFRIRILTKNAVVGSEQWVRFFAAHADRFVVGLSTGTLDDEWARKVEIGCSAPSARIRALYRLQGADVPTYGMLCPIFPDVLDDGGVERLVDHICPRRVEHIWAEPFNDRVNWEHVRAGYEPGSAGHTWLTDVYDNSRKDLWSRYATDLYARLRAKAEAGGWLHKLRYLLYEGNITEADSVAFHGLDGVLLQSKPGADGKSRNPCLARYQR